MKKFKFGLSNVHRIRQLQEEQDRSAMKQAEAELEKATAELDHRLAAIGATRRNPILHSAPEFQYERDQLQRHALAVSAARAAEANALSVMLVARGAWQESATAVRALDRLHERQHSTWLLESTRAAQAATDEIAQTHHGRDLR